MLTKYQHSFRSGLSCETQLLETTNDILSSHDAGEQVDAAILGRPLNKFPSSGNFKFLIFKFRELQVAKYVMI